MVLKYVCVFVMVSSWVGLLLQISQMLATLRSSNVPLRCRGFDVGRVHGFFLRCAVTFAVAARWVREAVERAELADGASDSASSAMARLLLCDGMADETMGGKQ
jgi:hypothetical protein